MPDKILVIEDEPIDAIPVDRLPADRFTSTATRDRNLDPTLSFGELSVMSVDDLLGTQEITMRSYDGFFEVMIGGRSVLVGDQAIPSLIEALQAHLG